MGPGIRRSTSIQLSEYHGQHPRKAPFVRCDRLATRFDVAGNQKAGRCTTRRTAHGAYPVNEIALARAALASQAQQRAKGTGKKEREKTGREEPYRVD